MVSDLMQCDDNMVALKCWNVSDCNVLYKQTDDTEDE